jgi:hypothetical protein
MATNKWQSFIKTLTEEQLKILEDNFGQLIVSPQVTPAKDIYEREIASLLPFSIDLMRAGTYHLSTPTINKEFIESVRKNSTIQVLLFGQPSDTPLQFTYVRDENSRDNLWWWSSSNSKICKCKLPPFITHCGTISSTHNCIEITVPERNTRSYLFEDWLSADSLHKQYDNLFGHYEPLVGYESIKNLRVVPRGTWELFMSIRNIPAQSATKLRAWFESLASTE